MGGKLRPASPEMVMGALCRPQGTPHLVLLQSAASGTLGVPSQDPGRQGVWQRPPAVKDAAALRPGGAGGEQWLLRL